MGGGEKFILRGMGLGGWMLQEGYMMRLGNIGQQHKIRAGMAALIGPDKTAAFYKGWVANHTRKIDIDSMAAWGFNSVRLPMHYRLLTLPVEEEPLPGGNTWLASGFTLIDSLLQWCKANKIYLILDLHAAPGGQGNDLPISDRDPSRPSLWENEADRKKMVALWMELARRYAGEPWIGGYDIINEPNWGFEDPGDKRGTAEKSNGPLRQLMMDITGAIRTVDKDHLIIIEGNGFGNNYRGVLPPWDSNMVLSFHKYGNYNNEAAIRSFLDLREKYNIPLWMGESGENSNTWFTEAIRLVETHDIGWSWWPLKKMGANNPLEIPVSKGYQQLLDYWNGKGARPSEKEANDALQQLLQDCRLENNIEHRDVVDAMFRQVYSTETLPFKENVIRVSGDRNLIRAVDYDLGSQGLAYFDRDSASYQYTPGVKTVGNRGRVYRNDGVDITGGRDSGYYVFSIEDGEWLDYTVRAELPGLYTIRITVAAAGDTSVLSLSVRSGKRKGPVLDGLAIPNTGGATHWQTLVVKDMDLPIGYSTIRVYAKKGGFNFYGFQLSLQK